MEEPRGARGRKEGREEGGEAEEGEAGMEQNVGEKARTGGREVGPRAEELVKVKEPVETKGRAGGMAVAAPGGGTGGRMGG